MSKMEEQLAALEAAEKGASPGPWQATRALADGKPWVMTLGPVALRDQSPIGEGHTFAPTDLALIVALRNNAADMIAEIRMLRAEVQRYASEEEIHPDLACHPLLRPDRKMGQP